MLTIWFGSTAMYVDGLRTPSFQNVNLTVNRQFRLAEKVRMEFLAEATNLLNKTDFNPSAVNGSVSAVLVANTATNTKVGQNSNVNHGSLGLELFEPRRIVPTGNFELSAIMGSPVPREHSASMVTSRFAFRAANAQGARPRIGVPIVQTCGTSTLFLNSDL